MLFRSPPSRPPPTSTSSREPRQGVKTRAREPRGTPGSQASSRGEAEDSALLSSRTGMSWSPLSDQKGVKPTVEFGERTRDCSPGHARKEGRRVAKTGASRGFSLSVRQPTRLPHPWDSPGKNTGLGCHFLLQCMKVKSESEVAQSCPTLSDSTPA